MIDLSFVSDFSSFPSTFLLPALPIMINTVDNPRDITPSLARYAGSHFVISILIWILFRILLPSSPSVTRCSSKDCIVIMKPSSLVLVSLLYTSGMSKAKGKYSYPC